MNRIGDWFQTYSGLAFYPMDPRPEEIRIEDIAQGLAFQCRYNGHCREYFSVAQHSVLVSWIMEDLGLPPTYVFWGLMHDAAESYLGDMIRPLKRSMPEYRRVERKVMRAIAKRFGLIWPEPKEVKKYDNIVLAMERRDLMGPTPAGHTWGSIEGIKPPVAEITPVGPMAAKEMFLMRFEEVKP